MVRGGSVRVRVLVILACLALGACTPLEVVGHALDWVGTDLVRSHDDTPWCGKGCEPDE